MMADSMADSMARLRLDRDGIDPWRRIPSDREIRKEFLRRQLLKC